MIISNVLKWLNERYRHAMYIDVRVFDDVSGQKQVVERNKYVPYYKKSGALNMKYTPSKEELYDLDREISYKEKGKICMNYIYKMKTPIPLVPDGIAQKMQERADAWALIQDDDMMRVSLMPPTRKEILPYILVALAIIAIPVCLYIALTYGVHNVPVSITTTPPIQVG